MNWLLALTVILTWQPVTEMTDGSRANIDHYNVYRRTTAGHYPVKPFTQRKTTKATLVLGSVCRSSIYFAVSAVDIKGRESDKSQEVKVETKIIPVMP